MIPRALADFLFTEVHTSCSYEVSMYLRRTYLSTPVGGSSAIMTVAS